MNETTGPIQILSDDRKFRLKLQRIVHRLLPDSMYFLSNILLREIDEASPQILEQLRKDLLELLT